MRASQNNRLLDALPPSSADRLLAAATHMDLPLETVLFRRDERPRYLYFLTAGLGSVVFTSEGGTSVELATQSDEGLIGCSYLMGPGLKSSSCNMQVAGSGYRVPLAILQTEFDNSAEVRGLFLEYAQFQYISSCQIGACNRLHRAEARFVRWLLMVADRLHTDVVDMTHEFLSVLLGTRRTTVTEVCAELGRIGAIEGRRGGLKIINRPLLEARVCECYPILRSRFDALYARS